MAVNKVNLGNITLQGGTDNTAFVTWTYTVNSKKPAEKFEYEWRYYTGQTSRGSNGKPAKIWFQGSTGSVELSAPKNCTYSIPENAKEIYVRVRPVSKKHGKNNSQVYFSASWVSTSKAVSNVEVPEVPSISVDMNKSILTMSADSYDSKTTSIEFEIVSDNATTVENRTIALSRNHAAYSRSVAPGHSYKVRARGVNNLTSGGWSNYSSEVYSSPVPPATVTAEGISENSIRVTWSAVTNATEYEIEYTTNSDWFDTNLDRVQSQTITSGTTLLLTELEDVGKTYYFRVRASAKANDPSEWSSIVSTTVGTVPEAPTTWSLSTTASVGETLYLYWTHNSEDGSKATWSDLEILANGTKLPIDPIENKKDESDDTGTYSYILDTSDFTFGTKLLWRVRTKGVIDNYGEWSIQREINVYAAPTIGITLGSDFNWLWDKLDLINGDVNETPGVITPLANDVMTAFPLWVNLEAGPTQQTPVGYYITIAADESYDGTNDFGESVHIVAGEEIFSRYYSRQSHSFVTRILPGDVIFEDGMSYSLTATVSMDSGLTATATKTFTVSWDEELYSLQADVGVDLNDLTASIMPYCDDDDGNPVSGITMAVYRREADGSFAEIMSGISNIERPTIIDPHPTLGSVSYRIAALSDTTGKVYFADQSPAPVNEKGIVIQWDETWKEFSEDGDEDIALERPWQGTMLKLPYNVDVSDSNDVDVEFAEYIGRSHPVSYYGTQKGSKSSWKADIPTSDTETIGLLRRLANYMGDVYVREPYGTGYWAQVKVQFELKHNTVITPVSLEVTRVEGGI